VSLFTLSVAKKAFMPSVITLNVVVPSVMAPQKWSIFSQVVQTLHEKATDAVNSPKVMNNF
jgi:hypothetical protein